jgi:hypothetical protein
MKASEYIAQFQALVDKHGDVFIARWNDDDQAYNHDTDAYGDYVGAPGIIKLIDGRGISQFDYENCIERPVAARSRHQHSVVAQWDTAPVMIAI